MGKAISGKAIKASDSKYVDRKAAKVAKKGFVAAFDGKVFADLTGGEKDDLLKVLAIAAGIISE